jgi:hypothetical protein
METENHHSFEHDPSFLYNILHSPATKLAVGLTTGLILFVIGPKSTEPDLRKPQQPPAQHQAAPQQLPSDSSALDTIVRDSSTIFIPGAGGDSVEASIDSSNVFPVIKVLSDSLAYNQFLRLYQK